MTTSLSSLTVALPPLDNQLLYQQDGASLTALFCTSPADREVLHERVSQPAPDSGHLLVIPGALQASLGRRTQMSLARKLTCQWRGMRWWDWPCGLP